MDISKTKAWKQLLRHRQDLGTSRIDDFFKADRNRFETYSATGADLFLDYSKNLLSTGTRQLLLDLARESGLPDAIEAMFNGDKINASESRAAMHFALRNPPDRALHIDGQNIGTDVANCLDRMARCSDKIRAGEWRGGTGKPISSIVHIGIGGSYLGPKMVSQALKPYLSTDVDGHYLANVDGSHISDLLTGLDPTTTLFIVVSKSFGTLETRLNADTARHWLLQSGIPEDGISNHFLAVTANPEAAIRFGIEADHLFPMWDWVGGRYSLWSAVGLPLCITLGADLYRELLAGAHAMDTHFREADLDANLPVLLALIGVWYINFFAAETHAIIPYDHQLRDLPAHLQQLEMESNGKSVTSTGAEVSVETAPIIWGGEGTNGQHAFHQLLHQGTRFVTADFIVSAQSQHNLQSHQDWLISNCLSQSQAMMVGKAKDEIIEELTSGGMSNEDAKRLAPHKVIVGNHPSNTIVMQRATPRNIGALIALYEHKVFCQGTIWGINSFDQWGVELGKQLSDNIFAQVTGEQNRMEFQDSSTTGLIAMYQKYRTSTKE
jgi:glucose-6-phosphate isomerase|tara:strand:- start:23376 stop:25031 length:1656 start_codon:yes stop_codon:yes gene_type:complete